MTNKEDRKAILVLDLVGEPKSWSGLLETSRFSKATLSRYMEELNSSGQIEKFLDSETDKIKYRATPKGEFKDKVESMGEVRNQILSHISDGKIHMDTMLDLSSQELPMLEKGSYYGFNTYDQEFNLSRLIDFLNFLKSYLGGELKINEAVFEFESNLDDFHVDIDELRNELSQ